MGNVALIAPGDIIEITEQWDDLTASGQTLTNVVHNVPQPLVKESEAFDASLNASQVRISGARHGVTYQINARATLSNGESIDKTFALRGWNS